jgi:hypothetical protein
MVKMVKENIRRYPKELSADAGYFSEASLKFLKSKTDAYIPAEKTKHNQKPDPATRGRIKVCFEETSC